MSVEVHANIVIALAPWDVKRLGEPCDWVALMISNIQRAHFAGKLKKRDYWITKYLGSHHARYAATVAAYNAMSPKARPAFEKIVGIAGSLNPWLGTNEPVNVRFKVKPNGNYRTIMDFGIENRALQYLIYPILRATAQLHPNQYGLKGVSCAVSRARDLIVAGYVWGTETDIANCFPSFEMDKVCNLIPLPKSVIENVIFSTHLNLVSPQLGAIFGVAEGSDDHNIVTDYLAAARRGIPQGSAISNLIADICLAKPLGSLPASACIDAYADNTLCLAKDVEEAVSMHQALWVAIKAAPVGLLQPKLTAIVEPGKPFDFLGYTLINQHGQVKISAKERHLEEFHQRWLQGVRKIKKASGAILKKRRRRELRRFVVSWTGARPLADNIKSFRVEWLKKLESDL